jgi:hypothetical protein
MVKSVGFVMSKQQSTVEQIAMLLKQGHDQHDYFSTHSTDVSTHGAPLLVLSC